MSSGEKIAGGVRPIDSKKAEDVLNASLTKLASGEGPSFKLGKIYSAETQVVAGSLTRIIADLIDADGNSKKYNVSIWSRPWLTNGVEVTFACDGESSTLVRKHDA